MAESPSQAAMATDQRQTDVAVRRHASEQIANDRYANRRRGAFEALDAVYVDLNALIAMLVYALLAWLLATLIWLIFGETRSAVKAPIQSTETHVAH